MGKWKNMIILLILTISLTSCNKEQKDKQTTTMTSNTTGLLSYPVNQTKEKPSLNDGLCDIAKEYLDDEELNKYTTDELNQKGVTVDDGLKFDDRYKGDIVKNIDIGTTKKELIQLLGEPDFISDKYPLSIYKTDKFYIAFYGAEKTDEVYIVKKHHIPKGYMNILADFCKNQYLQEYPDFCYSRQYSRGTMDYDYMFGVHFHTGDENIVTVYKDFEGSRIDGNPDVKIEYVDEDYVLSKVIGHYNHEKYLNNYFKESGVFSPNGKIIALCDNNDLYEYARVRIKYPGRESTDYAFGLGHFPSGLTWLNDRYFFVSIYTEGLYVYDMINKEPTRITKEDDGNDVQLKSIDTENRVIEYTFFAGGTDEEKKIGYRFDEKSDIHFTEVTSTQ